MPEHTPERPTERTPGRTAVLAELPENQLTLLCRHVFLAERRAAYVEPTEEGILVVACGEGDHGDGPEDWVSAGFGTIALREPGLRDCPPIPLGRAAERTDEGGWEIVEPAGDAPVGDDPEDEP